MMAGDCDLLLRVVAADQDDDHRFLIEHLTHIKGGARRQDRNSHAENQADLGDSGLKPCICAKRITAVYKGYGSQFVLMHDYLIIDGARLAER